MKAWLPRSIAIVTLVLGCITSASFAQTHSDKLRIYFIDVEGGQSTLFVTPQGESLLIDAGCDVIVSDDGLQHEALGRDCEIVVVDGRRGFGNGRLLPAGPLREPTRRLAKVDAVVVNGPPESTDPWASAVTGGTPPTFHMRLEASRAVALADGTHRELDTFAGAAVHALAGIGNPERFFAMLRENGMAVHAHPLADHARIGPGDILFGDAEPVLMTEKDAVKCAAHADARHWYVPVDACFSDADGDALLGIVTLSMAARIRSEDEVPLG